MPNLSTWTREKKKPAEFFHIMGKGDWYGFRNKGGRLVRGSALREAIISEELAKTSPGVAIAALGTLIWDLWAYPFYAKMESARLLLQKACWNIDQGEDFRQASSLAKYLAVALAREVTIWAADIFGAASVIYEHPIHKYPLDIWGSSLAEGIQDVQKLIIFRELMRKYPGTVGGGR